MVSTPSHKPTALEMMLKAMGVDIESIKSEVFETIRQVLGGIRELVATQKRIERKLDAIIAELHVPYKEEHAPQQIEAKAREAA